MWVPRPRLLTLEAGQARASSEAHEVLLSLQTGRQVNLHCLLVSPKGEQSLLWDFTPAAAKWGREDRQDHTRSQSKC